MKAFCVKAVLFDFDGTLSRPGSLDFNWIKKELGCPLDRPVLEFIRELPDETERKRAMDALNAFEQAGAEDSEPNLGAEETVRAIRALGLGVGLITRNRLASIERALENFQHLTPSDFDVIVTRDHPPAPKPSPEGILFAADRLGVDVSELVLVGDFVFDVLAGERAGAVTVFLSNRRGENHPRADFTIGTLGELLDILRMGLSLRAGKLPNDLLVRFLSEFAPDDPSIRIGPGMGEDTAVVEAGGAELLVMTSDPITFATDAAGIYAVAVNANDMATSGALPRWMITTLLFPIGTTPSQVRHLMGELGVACSRWGITLCGGHTEITDAVSRPVAVGTLVGTVSREGLVDKRKMRPGDALLMTKSAGLEGTAILAREFEDRLRQGGIGKDVLERASDLLSHIAILEEARICASFPATSAMHDVTEGGVATALVELSVAGGRGLRVDLEAVPVSEDTRCVAAGLGIDPLGLIGSGSLLICCRPAEAPALVEAIRSRAIPVRRIGEVIDREPGVEAHRSGEPAILPSFEVDEITRLFG